VAVHLDRRPLAEAIESMLAPGQGQRYCVGHRAHVPDDGVAQLIELVRPVVAAELEVIGLYAIERGLG